MKKKQKIILALGSVLLILGFCLFQYNSKIKHIITGKPEVVDYFACGDNCLGPAEKYTVKAYKDVSDPKECERLGGKPKSFIGWGETHYCLAE